MLLEKVALVTGGSRGVGEATVLALAEAGAKVAFTYRSKEKRANWVVSTASRTGSDVISIRADMTDATALQQLVARLRGWTDHIDLLVLNASGGLENDLTEADAEYPMKINCFGQVACVRHLLPLMPHHSTIVFVTSHWAHLYGQIEQLPSYEQVAKSKHAGEAALRRLLREEAQNIRFVVVSGDIIEGTITPRLLERASRNLIDDRRQAIGELPTVTDMASAIVEAASDSAYSWRHTVMVGAPWRPA